MLGDPEMGLRMLSSNAFSPLLSPFSAKNVLLQE